MAEAWAVAKAFRVDILTRERCVLSDDIVSLVAPGTSGYLGVRPGHAPLITELKVGRISLRTLSGQEVRIAISGGLLEVWAEATTLLAETAERAEEIDAERARRAMERARGRLAGEMSGDTDVERARLALMRAINRLEISER